MDLETLSLFKSRTDLACLQDLLNAKCFIGKAHNVLWLLCMNDCFNLSYVDILNKLKHVFMLMQYLDIMDVKGVEKFIHLFIIEFVKCN